MYKRKTKERHNINVHNTSTTNINNIANGEPNERHDLTLCKGKVHNTIQNETTKGDNPQNKDTI